MINLKGFINKDMAKDPNKLFDLQIDTIIKYARQQ